LAVYHFAKQTIGPEQQQMPRSIALFLEPSGRIGRRIFWLATLGFVVLWMVLMFVLSPDMFADTPTSVPPSQMMTAASLLGIWPFTVLSVKRFNDRNYPNWVGWLVGSMTAIWTIAEHFGRLDVANWSSMPFAERLILALVLLVLLWSFYENGFLRGTIGPNRYGPDPLAT
jgi:uncharacterized membrane protein YhaH (DUF805 family)